MKLSKKSVLLICSFILYSAPAAADTAVSCYKIPAKDSPRALVDSRPRHETWCYDRASAPARGLFVFNADTQKVRPELAFVLDANGEMTHGSLLAGKISVHRLPSGFLNPYSVPLKEPKHLKARPGAYTPAVAKSAAETLQYLISQPQSSVSTFSAYAARQRAAAAVLPWRGYWWPVKGAPMAGSANSPMGKFDRFIYARTGQNPGSAAWENSHHYYKGVWWEGHCNGWAASSMLRPEPRFTRRDAVSGISFSISDQKGLLSEKDYCANVAFFGTRNNGPSSNNFDVDSATFHKVLLYYIGQLGKPIAVDYRSDAAVDTHVISGYTMDTQDLGNGYIAVTTHLTVHRYDAFMSNYTGAAPTYIRTYRYTVRQGSGGSFAPGRWQSDNPDFMWVALSPANCSAHNPRLRNEWMSQVFRLPGAY